MSNKSDINAKPFVKWVGGKRQLLEQFKKFYPKKFDFKKNTYFEPFVGGGAVFFHLRPRNAILSDSNKDLVITYQVIRDKVDELIAKLKKYPHDKDFFLRMRGENFSNKIDIASRFIYLNRTCFNGLYRVNKSGIFNVPFGRYTNPVLCDEDNLRSVSKTLQGVQIKKQDYKMVLRNANKGDFVYFDPPYYPISKTSSFTSYTSGSFLDKEQIELRNIFAKLHKLGCFVMLSNSDTPFINEIYSEIKGARITKVTAGRAINSIASKRGKITEVLVTNY